MLLQQANCPATYCRWELDGWMVGCGLNSSDRLTRCCSQFRLRRSGDSCSGGPVTGGRGGFDRRRQSRYDGHDIPRIPRNDHVSKVRDSRDFPNVPRDSSIQPRGAFNSRNVPPSLKSCPPCQPCSALQECHKSTHDSQTLHLLLLISRRFASLGALAFVHHWHSAFSCL